MSNLNAVSFVAHQQSFKLFDNVDQELPEAIGQHVLCFLVAPIINAGHQDLALESSAHPTANASGFPPVILNFAYWSDWCQMNFLVFLKILGFTRHLRIAIMPGRRWLPVLVIYS